MSVVLWLRPKAAPSSSRIRHSMAAFSVAASLLVTASGCAAWRKDSGSDHPYWGQDIREPTAPGQLFGISQESREIERNLGVR